LIFDLILCNIIKIVVFFDIFGNLHYMSDLSSRSLSDLVRDRLRFFFEAHTQSLPKDLYSIIMEQVEKPLIEQTLLCAHGNQCRAAEILGLSRNTLRQKMQRLSINASDFK
jgi:Fis family transcriptional regulator